MPNLISNLLGQNSLVALFVLAIFSYLSFLATRFVLARVAYFIVFRTKSVYDDLLVDRVQPFRVAWLLPLYVIYFYRGSIPIPGTLLEIPVLILGIWIGVDFLNATLSGINDIYRHNPRYTGVSVAGYVGLIRVAVIVVGASLTISIIFDIDVQALLAGIGAWLAVLLLIFRDTILSFMASVQLSTQHLIKEGDAIDVPAYGASGIVSDIELQTITIHNFDNTISTIPTGKIVDVGFKNERRMYESGARRIKQSILIDIDTVNFVTSSFVKGLRKKGLEEEFFKDLTEEPTERFTNLQLFMKYADIFLRNRKDVRQKNYPYLLRVLEQTPTGLPLEIYVFVISPNWENFQAKQSEIMIHLIATLPIFGLKAYQSQ